MASVRPWERKLPGPTVLGDWVRQTGTLFSPSSPSHSYLGKGDGMQDAMLSESTGYVRLRLCSWLASGEVMMPCASN